MASVPSLLSQVAEPANLGRAWRHVSSTRHSQGYVSHALRDFAKRSDGLLQVISAELRDAIYQPECCRGVLLDKESGSGMRPILVPAPPDAVVQRAILQVISPKLRSVIETGVSFGCVGRKKLCQAISRIVRLARRGYGFVLEADLKSFFDTIDQQLLMDRLHEHLPDESLDQLILDFAQAEISNLDKFSPEQQVYFPDPTSGIPQGSALSPLLANLYLAAFDRGMTAAGYKLIRYLDDFVVMCGSREEAENAYATACGILIDELKLSIHELGSEKTRVVSYSKGFKFLGIRFEKRNRYPSPESEKRCLSRTDAITDVRRGETIVSRMIRLQRLLNGWVQHYLECDCSMRPVAERVDHHILERTGHLLAKKGFVAHRGPATGDELAGFGVPTVYGTMRRIKDRKR